MKKSNVSPRTKAPTTFKILGNETLIIAYYEMFRFATMDIKLWLKNDNIL